MIYKISIHVTVVKSSCTQVIKVGVAYVNICILRHLKEELTWAIDKPLQVISNKVVFKTVIPL